MKLTGCLIDLEKVLSTGQKGRALREDAVPTCPFYQDWVVILGDVPAERVCEDEYIK